MQYSAIIKDYNLQDLIFFSYFIVFTIKKRTSGTKSDEVFLKQTLTKDFSPIYFIPTLIQQLFNYVHIFG